MDLPKMLAGFINELPDDSKMTFDDFFEVVNIPKDQRSDYVIAAMLKQAEERKLL